jgi:hypothetical protein
MADMKGITCCGDCFYYDWNKKRCKRGASIEYNPKSYFFADCPLPSVEPERPKGRWIEHKEWDFKARDYFLAGYNCSCCGLWYLNPKKYDFCPNCGADMRGESDE